MEEYVTQLVIILENEIRNVIELAKAESIEHDGITNDIMWEDYHNAKHLKHLIYEKAEKINPVADERIQRLWEEMEEALDI